LGEATARRQGLVSLGFFDLGSERYCKSCCQLEVVLQTNDQEEKRRKVNNVSPDIYMKTS